MLECNEHKQEGIESRHLGGRIDRTYWQSRWSVLVCCCCHNKLPEIWQLTQHPFIISQFWWSEVQGAQLGSRGSAGFFASSLTKAEIKLLAGLEALRENCFQAYSGCSLNSIPRGCRTKVTLFFLAGCHLGVSLRPSLPLVPPRSLLHLRSSNSTLYSQAASSLWLTLLPSSSTFKVACDYICFTFSLF